ncbi:uncharacterized protein DS421_14g455230 [Arachis hypogaea]|nr:uncharacterized protein DS421_14g455230 [Arachis hypogaea]
MAAKLRSQTRMAAKLRSQTRTMVKLSSQIEDGGKLLSDEDGSEGAKLCSHRRMTTAKLCSHRQRTTIGTGRCWRRSSMLSLLSVSHSLEKKIRV